MPFYNDIRLKYGFTKEVEESVVAEQLVAEWLQNIGYNVQLHHANATVQGANIDITAALDGKHNHIQVKHNLTKDRYRGGDMFWVEPETLVHNCEHVTGFVHVSKCFEYGAYYLKDDMRNDILASYDQVIEAANPTGRSGRLCIRVYPHDIDYVKYVDFRHLL